MPAEEEDLEPALVDEPLIPIQDRPPQALLDPPRKFTKLCYHVPFF